VQLVSALLQHGPEHLAVVRRGFEQWGEKHGYESIDEIRDSMSLVHSAYPRAVERRNYLNTLQSWKHAA
jgi:dihydroorotate dehydrogenase (fumarate)